MRQPRIPSTKVKQIQASFASGELAPNLYARVDLAKYKTGVAYARNFFVDFRGGLTYRPGTRYIGAGFYLMPFVVGQQDGFVLAWNPPTPESFYPNGSRVEIYQLGVLIQTISVPYAVADVPNIKWGQSADVMTLTHTSYPPGTITYQAGVFSFAVIVVGAKQAPPTNLVVTDGGTTDPDYCWSYLVTAVSLDGKSESLPSVPVLKHYTIPDIVTGWAEQLSWTPSTSPTSLYNVYKCGPFDDRDATGPGTIWGLIGSTQATVFSDTNIAPDFSKEPPLFGDPFSPGQFASINVVSGGSGYPSGAAWTGYIPLTITDTGAGTGAVGYLLTDHAGVGRGVFLISAGNGYVNPTVTAGAGGATFSFTLSSIGTADPTYPSTVSYDQQRQIFGGSIPKPNTLVLSVVGDYSNFNTTAILQDSDAISEDIVTNQANNIQAFQPVSYGLLIFTTGGLFLASGGSAGAVVSPSTFTLTAQASEGANALRPLAINYAVLYMQYKGNIVRDAQFAWQRQSYVGTDISTLSNHLFDNYNFVQWDWSEAPNKLVWLVRSDGTNLSMAYVPDQEVYGWTHHDTQGIFASVVSVPEAGVNATYFVVYRYLPPVPDPPGPPPQPISVVGDWVSYVERLQPLNQSIYDCWYLDSALPVLPPYPTDTIYPPFWLNTSGVSGSVTLTLETHATLPIIE